MSEDLNVLRLQLLANLDNQFTPFYQEISDYILGLLTKYQELDRIGLADSGEKNAKGDPVMVKTTIKGQIPISAIPKITNELNDYLNKKFLGVSGQPYTVNNQGTIIPNSDYFAALFTAITLATKLGVSENYLIMAEILADEPDLKAKLSMGTLNPLEGAKLPWSDSSLGNYDPAHQWIDPSGKDLSARIWDVTGDAKKKLDLYLTESIKSAKTARDMSDELEQFMLPGQALQRTDRPYGTDVSFSGMRLARTEVASAQIRASHASAVVNPFVEKYQPMLSRNHPEPDECDDFIAEGPYDKSDISGLPPFHPQCLCRVKFFRERETSNIIDDLRSSLENIDDPSLIPITPLRLEAFVELLLNGV